MYFTREAQQAAVARLQRALLPGGWLVVSSVETSTDLFRPLVPVNFPGAILYRKEQQSALSSQLSAISPTLTSWQAETVLPGPSAPLPHVEMPAELVTSQPEEQADVPPDTGTLLQRARALADQGNLEQARRLCEAGLARDRLDPETHLLLAAICQERGEIPAALETLRRAIYLAPDSIPAHFLLGSLLLRQGERRRGLRCLETVVHLLSAVPPDVAVSGTGDLTAGRLLETVRLYLEYP